MIKDKEKLLRIHADQSIERVSSMFYEYLRNSSKVMSILVESEKELKDTLGKSFSDIIAHIESSLGGYVETWGDSDDMRLVIFSFFDEMALSLDEERKECGAIISELCRSDALPTLLFAAGSAAEKTVIDNGIALDSQSGRKGFLTLWLRGLSHAPAEVLEGGFETLRRGAVRQTHHVKAADFGTGSGLRAHDEGRWGRY